MSKKIVLTGGGTAGHVTPNLAAGVEACRNEWIARMDSDDIACPDRCEKQLRRYAEEAVGKSLGKKAEQGKLGFLSGKIAEFAAAEVPEQENVEFGREKVQVMGAFGPIEVENPKTGKKEPLMKEVNTVRFRESTDVDGTIIVDVTAL